MTEPDRFSRQERLSEVGPSGQERIQRFRAVVCGTECAEVERAYLSGAGVGSVSTREGEAPRPFAHAGAFHFDAAREVGAAAWRALAELRRALEIG
jgi:hypothetical protein